MSYRVNNKHIECALDYLNDCIGKRDGELGCIRTYGNQVVQLVTEGGGIRVLAYTSTKREAYDAIQAMTNFHRYTQEETAA
jgi:hypothetical protein